LSRVQDRCIHSTWAYGEYLHLQHSALLHCHSETIHTIGGQVKCSVRSMFSCCFALAISSVLVVWLLLSQCSTRCLRRAEGTCLQRAGLLLDRRQGFQARASGFANPTYLRSLAVNACGGSGGERVLALSAEQYNLLLFADV
jgi:hypothetical protein